MEKMSILIGAAGLPRCVMYLVGGLFGAFVLKSEYADGRFHGCKIVDEYGYSRRADQTEFIDFGIGSAHIVSGAVDHLALAAAELQLEVVDQGETPAVPKVDIIPQKNGAGIDVFDVVIVGDVEAQVA